MKRNDFRFRLLLTRILNRNICVIIPRRFPCYRDMLKVRVSFVIKNRFKYIDGNISQEFCAGRRSNLVIDD